MNIELEIERAIMREKLGLERKLNSKKRLKPIHLPENPSTNWTYRGRSLKPIYLPGQK